MDQFTTPIDNDKNNNDHNNENGDKVYYDILLEDNVCIPKDASVCSNRIWQTIEAIQEMEQE